MSRIEARLAELGITLPTPMAPVANYVPYVISGDLVVVSGQIPARDGKIAYTGKLGDAVPLDVGVQAAQLCFINVLAQLKVACGGDLDRVQQVIRLGTGLGPADFGHALAQACTELGLSSVHITFCTEPEWTDLGQAGWLRRMGMQFHWDNAGYTSFEDFLAALSSRKRKSIRRERRDANDCGLEFVTLRGGDITSAHWKAFFRFYTSTVDRKWGSAYLTPQFFPLLGNRLGDQVVLMLALQAGKPIAGALNLAGADTLYGRNWGCEADYPFLHFELCYYRAIDFAIEHRLARVEAGAQGEHKIQRGYLPTPTYSAHWICHEGLRRAVDVFLEEERSDKLAEMAALATLSPFRDTSETA